MAQNTAIILAAGQGTRMRSSLPKVMHKIGNLPMLWHVVRNCQSADINNICVVLGPDSGQLQEALLKDFPQVHIVEQIERLGTGHAALMAQEVISQNKDGKVLVLYGDVPLIQPQTIANMLEGLESNDLVVLGFNAKDPTGYGRLLVEEGQLKAIREHKDATEQEKQVSLCNSGLMGFRANNAVTKLKSLSNTNAQAEYYLTDMVEAYGADGLKTGYLTTSEQEVSGVNNRVQLSQAEKLFQARMREAAMVEGVTLQDPDTVYFSYDTKIEPDVLVEPYVVFGANVEVRTGAHIRAHSYFEGAIIGSKAIVGPYARLREGTVLAEDVKIGNFVETKKVNVAKGAKINHLSYIGDASVGANANIGAGTITCNYDGFNKFKTEIGEGSFIGSNSALVAPVSIGKGAYVGSGSVIVEDVPEDSLAIARGKQVHKAGWANTFRKNKPKK